MTSKSASQKIKVTKLSKRNPMHDHPLLSKGGIHRKTNKSKRCLDKMKIKKEWLPQNIFSAVYFGESFLIV